MLTLAEKRIDPFHDEIRSAKRNEQIMVHAVESFAIIHKKNAYGFTLNSHSNIAVIAADIAHVGRHVKDEINAAAITERLDNPGLECTTSVY